MSSVCCACLSRHRTLRPLRRVAAAYALLMQQPELEEMAVSSLVCWECHSLLARLLRFQTQVLHANLILQSYSDTMKDVSYSLLDVTRKIGFDVELQHFNDTNSEHGVSWAPSESEGDYNTMHTPVHAEVKCEMESTLLNQDTATMEAKPVRKKTTARRRKEIKEKKITTVELSEYEMQRFREEDREREAYVKAPFKCETCIKSFIFVAMLERHNASKHDPSQPHECAICRERFATLEQMSRHRGKHYAVYRCGVCGHSSRSRAELGEHCAGHEPAQTHACRVCRLPLESKRKLRYHMETTHKESVKCDVCGKVMINRYSLKHHMLTHTGMPTFECGICHKVYRGEAGLYSHMRHFHSDDPTETYCAQCDIHFKNKTIYRSHLKRSEKHATPDQLKFACEKCPKRFLSEASLRKHHRYYHLDYVCNICQKRLKNWFSLDNHVKYVHEGREMPRKHMCETCGKGFKTKTMLSNHQTTHTGARPHACELCGATFSVKASLRTHRNHVHLKTKPDAAPAGYCTVQY